MVVSHDELEDNDEHDVDKQPRSPKFDLNFISTDLFRFQLPK